MKVIFIKDVGGVGQRGSVRDVSDGYALNFLIPNGFAEQATTDKIAAHEIQMKKDAESREAELRSREDTVKGLEGMTIRISARATEKGGLFKAIVQKDIARAISAEGKSVNEEDIVLAKPIKQVGEHVVEVRAGSARAKVTVAVNQS